MVQRGRKRRKDVVVHTHFNHPNEITAITEEALGRLFEAGITVRNQAVLQRGVNDDARHHAPAAARGCPTSTCSRTTSTCTTW